MQKYDSLKELHIHIDLLKNSDHGIDILRQKLGNLLKKYKYIQFFFFFFKKKAILYNQLEFERSIYNEYSEQYFQMEHKIVLKSST